MEWEGTALSENRPPADVHLATCVEVHVVVLVAPPAAGRLNRKNRLIAVRNEEQSMPRKLPSLVFGTEVRVCARSATSGQVCPAVPAFPTPFTHS
ncbi:unnamed protein product [Strongylus vulgaris]|uniref:Uncharacterized protein n=1 Tax=Strongylus vulgaris TaxID=40348 RepID=A0A3P7K670_STRVU|nr:unnamed protein product [Strongylus vulgaris]